MLEFWGLSSSQNVYTKGTLGGQPSQSYGRGMRRANVRRAVCYLRVSTDIQDLGLDAQRVACEAWAQKHGLEVVAVCEDRISGRSEVEERPGLTDALRTLVSARAGVLLIARRDRLARDAGLAAVLDRLVRRAGGSIVSADGVGNGEDPSSSFFRSILDAASAYERALLGQRTRAAMAVKKARGERVSRWPPYGWRIEGRQLVEDEGEQKIIRAILELDREGLSQRSICALLREHGAKSRGGRPFHLTSVQRVLHAFRKAS